MALDEKVHDALFSEATLSLGQIHWMVLRAARAMDRERWGAGYKYTEFGKGRYYSAG